MDDNTWKFAQLMMWIIGIQTTVIIAFFTAMWIAISNRFEQVDKKFDQINQRFDKIDQRFEKLEEKISKLESDTIQIKSILQVKEFLVYVDRTYLKKAE